MKMYILIFFDNGIELFAREIFNLNVNEDNFNEIISNASDFIVDNFDRIYGNYSNIKKIKNYELALLIYPYIKNNIEILFIDKIYHYLIISLFGLSIEYDRFDLIKKL